MQGAGQIGELVPHRERSATQRILGNNLAPCALRPAPRDQDGIAARLRCYEVLCDQVRQSLERSDHTYSAWRVWRAKSWRLSNVLNWQG